MQTVTKMHTDHAGFAFLDGPATISNLRQLETMVIFVATFNVQGCPLQVHVHTSAKHIEDFCRDGKTANVCYLSARLFSVVTPGKDAKGLQKAFSDGYTGGRAVAEAHKIEIYFDGGALSDLPMPKLTLRGGVESFSRDDSTYTVSVTQWDPIFEDDSTLRVSVMVPDAPLRLRRAPIPAGYQVHCSGLILGVLNLGDATDMLSIVIEDIMVFRLTKLPRSINLWRQGFEAVEADTDESDN